MGGGRNRLPALWRTPSGVLDSYGFLAGRPERIGLHVRLLPLVDRLWPRSGFADRGNSNRRVSRFRHGGNCLAHVGAGRTCSCDAVPRAADARPESSMMDVSRSPSSSAGMRVGVAIPAYRSAELIGRTLRSVVAQRYTNWTCVVVNDGPDEGTRQVVERIGDRRIRYVCDGARRGQFGNFNRAILEVLREDPNVIRLLCSDDVLYPDDLGDMVRVFTNNPRVGLVATHYDAIDAEDRLIFRVDLRGRDDLVMPRREYLLKGVAVGNTIGGPSSVAIRREAIETAGLFDTRVNHSGEADLWHRIANLWDVAWVGHRAGLQYRIHA